jgi:hypothetical protein
MFLKTSLTTVVATALLATGLVAQQASTASPQQTSKAPVVSLIGCVHREPAAAPAGGATQPTPQVVAYRLTDVQPGTGTTVNLKAESQFFLTVATSLPTPIDLGKYQNQWVEVTGTISPVTAATAKPQTAPPKTGQAAPVPLSMLTATAVKVVSTECK